MDEGLKEEELVWVMTLWLVVMMVWRKSWPSDIKEMMNEKCL